MACDNCKDLTAFYCPICAPTTPAKPAVCEICHDATCPCGKVVMRTDAELIDALRACRWILSQRALAAEKQLATIAERVKALKQAHRFACFVKYSGCVCDVDMGRNRAIDAAVAIILNDTETK